ncbi:pimeloyl-ACP methyl ester carboxylesterase [Bacillus oleivorans]|uniref:Pimeloyl-ACP methyl ester carboxylesterase n=1 Tax=Bacillus oleivorans TaxID=1448271 RepID=A0A285CR56_9BACI|nr:alpha/beta hydrolase [Bacillus oleivorans]SNX70059.1 pimeloyl-ACP methyl ester carboxylesterase [Bacillus oleivorans]
MKTVINYSVLPNGERIAYQEREGGDIPFVLIHGNMTSSVHWDIVIERLDPKFKVYAVDMRGFGHSSYHQRIESIRDFSEDIKAWADEIGLRNFICMGWSTGGAVGMQLAADHPGYISQLLLLASASTRGYAFYAALEDGLPDVNKRFTSLEEIKQDIVRTIPIQNAYDEKNKGFLEAVWNAAIYRKKQPERDRYDRYLEDMLTQRNLAEVYHALNTFNISPEYNGLTEGTNQVKDIMIPVAVLYGEEDMVVLRQMTEEILEDFGGRAEAFALKGCGHSPLIDDPDQLLSAIEGFLQKVGV